MDLDDPLEITFVLIPTDEAPDATLSIPFEGLFLEVPADDGAEHGENE